jgi:Predicted TIM-barrel enzyme
MEYQAAMPSLVATGNNDGFGMGGGLLGGLVLGSVLNRGFGNFGGGYGYGNGMPCGGYGGIDGLNNLQGAIDTNAILSNLADIKAAVPLAEGQMQLALAGAQSDITQQNQAQTLALTNQLFTGQLANVQGFANTKDAVDSLSTQVAIGQGVTNTNIERLGWQLATTVKDDGEKTRALITSNQIAELNRIAAERQDEIIELRNEGRRRDDRHGIEINMINNQNQNQLQFQQQQQLIGQLAHCVSDVSQIARATNQSLIIGNTGAVASGPQTANPTNVRA